MISIKYRNKSIEYNSILFFNRIIIRTDIQTIVGLTARREMNTAAATGRGFLQITSKRLLPNVLKQKEKTLGYQKKITFKAKIVPKVEIKPVDEGFLVTHIDLDWAYNYINNNNLKFTPTTAKGWLLEYFKYSTHKQEGIRTIAHQGEEKTIDEILNTVWDPRAAGKGLFPDVSAKGYDFHISPDGQTLTLKETQEDAELKFRPSDFKKASQEAGANKSFAEAAKAKWKDQQPVRENKVTEEIDETSGNVYLKLHTTEAEVLAIQTNISPKTELKETEGYTHDTLLDADLDSVSSVETAALLISNAE